MDTTRTRQRTGQAQTPMDESQAAREAPREAAKEAPLIAWFEQVGKKDVASVGGKGANLGELTRARPAGAAGLRRHLGGLRGGDGAGARVAARALRGGEAGRPRGPRRGLRASCAPWCGAVSCPRGAQRRARGVRHGWASGRGGGALLGDGGGRGGHLLRRHARDLHQRARATATLLARIVDCWASLYGQRVIAYRHAQRTDGRAHASPWSCSAWWTASARASCSPRTRPTATPSAWWWRRPSGSGEVVVGGQVRAGHLRRRQARAEAARDARGREDVRHPPRQGRRRSARGAARRQGRARRVLRTRPRSWSSSGLARQVEEHYGQPQDMEWAHDGRRFYLVQSRPITALPAFDQAANDEAPARPRPAPAAPARRKPMVAGSRKAAHRLFGSGAAAGSRRGDGPEGRSGSPGWARVRGWQRKVGADAARGRCASAGRRGPGGADDQSRLGADHAPRLGAGDRQRRDDLPRGHREPRAAACPAWWARARRPGC